MSTTHPPSEDTSFPGFSPTEIAEWNQEGSTSFNTMATPGPGAGLLSIMTIDDIDVAGLPLEQLIAEAKAIIAEVERCVLAGQGHLLPGGWAQMIHSIIDKAEARIRSEQASPTRGENQHRGAGWDSTEAWWQANQDVSYPTAEASRPENDDHGHTDETGFADDNREYCESDILAELGNYHAHREQRFVLAESHSKLEEIQNDIQALLTVIWGQMTDFRALGQRQISDLAWYSILEEECGILLDLNNEIYDLYEPPDGMGAGLAHEALQSRFDALPVQLHAVFNMRCQEWELQGRDIGDEEMTRMVLENQKRTDVLRNIQDFLERKNNVVLEMEKTLEEYNH